MINKKIILFAFFLFFISIVYAQQTSLPNPVKLNNAATLTQICENCTYINVTILKYPNSTEIVINGSMFKSTGGNYYYILNDTFVSQNGEYSYTTCGDPNGIYTCEPVSFLVNPLGKTFTNQQAILYFLIFIVALLFFIGLMAIGIYLPTGNKRDEITGYLLQVSNIKYLKMLCLGFAYLFLVLLTYFGWMISYGYLDLDFIGNIFNVSFIILAWLILPLFILLILVSIYLAVQDSKLSSELQMGLRVK